MQAAADDQSRDGDQEEEDQAADDKVVPTHLLLSPHLYHVEFIVASTNKECCEMSPFTHITRTSPNRCQRPTLMLADRSLALLSLEH
jgi:hypothetical protein